MFTTYRLFGSQPISFRLIGGIGTFSILSFFSVSPILYINNDFKEISILNGISLFLMFAFVILLWFNEKNSIPFILYILLSVVILSFEYYYGTTKIVLGILSFLLISLIFSISLYKLMTYGFRKVVTGVVYGHERFKSILLFISGLIILCLGWYFFYSLLIDQIDLSSIKSGNIPIFGNLLKVMYFLAMFVFTLLMPVVMLLIYTAIFLVILINSIFWAISKGLFRFLYEHEIIKNRKILSATGLLCLGIAFPTLANIEKIGKILEKIF